MNKLVARQRLVMTFTFFSMFFGAGNLIFRVKGQKVCPESRIFTD